VQPRGQRHDPRPASSASPRTEYRYLTLSTTHITVRVVLAGGGQHPATVRMACGRLWAAPPDHAGLPGCAPCARGPAGRPRRRCIRSRSRPGTPYCAIEGVPCGLLGRTTGTASWAAAPPPHLGRPGRGEHQRRLAGQTLNPDRGRTPPPAPWTRAGPAYCLGSGHPGNWRRPPPRTRVSRRGEHQRRPGRPDLTLSRWATGSVPARYLTGVAAYCWGNGHTVELGTARPRLGCPVA